MIEVRNLKHVYNTKSKNKVLALKGISCKFDNQGMNFIVGKSGCGKSTFLNLLGGLDKIKDGDIIIDNASMKDFSPSDYDAYRASYVGIIFQEFNLLEDLTVYENIEFQLKLAGVFVNEDIIENSLKKVGLEGYGNRRSFELSGGEIQRVAIARQLAKGVKLLLADEPTGNLDSENAENVFNVLKKLSKDILVVVISHDTDSASRFADRIIKIKDGLLESIEDVSSTLNNNNMSVYKSIKPQFPKKYTFKFAFKNLFKRKIRLVISLILTMFCFGMFSVTGSIITTNTENVISNYYLKNPQTNYLIAQGKYSSGDTSFRIEDGETINEQFIDYFDNKIQVPKIKVYNLNIGSYIGFAKDYTISGYGVVENALDLESTTGYKLMEGYLPLDINSIYLTDYYANACIKNGGKYIKYGVPTDFEKDFKLEDLVGLKICPFNAKNTDNFFKVAGIIKTDYEKYDFLVHEENKTDNTNSGSAGGDNPLNGGNAIGGGNPSNGNSVVVSNGDSEKEKKRIEKRLSVFYMTEDCFENIMVRPNSFTPTFGNKLVLNETALDMRAECFKNGLNLANNGNYVLTDNEVYRGKNSDFTMNRGEIVINLDTYNKIFGETDKLENYVSVDYLTNITTLTGKYPKHIDEQITFEFKSSSNEVLFSKTYILKGLIINSLNAEFGQFVHLNETDFEKLMLKVRPCVSYYIVSGDYFQTNMQEILTDMRSFDVGINSEFSNIAYMSKEKFERSQIYYTLICLAFLIVSVVMFMNYIANTISDRQKDVGIIRSLGGRRIDVFRIFFIMSLIFFVLTNIFSNVFYLVLIPILNSLELNTMLATHAMSINAQFFFINPIIILIVLGISFLATSLASIIPIILVSKKSPMETIRRM